MPWRAATRNPSGFCYRDHGSRAPSGAVGFKSRRVAPTARRGAFYNAPTQGVASMLGDYIGPFFSFIQANFTHDNVTATATVVIAIFTVTLWFSTYKLWKSGEIHSERE